MDVVANDAALSAKAAEMREVLKTAVDLHQKGHFPQAEQLYRTLLRIDPQHAGALHWLGALANDCGAHERAAELIARAIDIDGQPALYHYHLGMALHRLERYDDAAAAYRQATVRDPNFHQAFENLGVALQECGEDQAAAEAYERAIKLDGRSPLAHRNLGTLRLALGEWPLARTHFECALDENPADAAVRFKRAALALQLGEYAAGWDDYELRFCDLSFARSSPPAYAPWPKWTGDSLAGRTLLVHAEQGIGDDVLFGSCYADVIAQAAHCVLVTDERMVALYARSFPAATVVAAGEPLDGLDIDVRIAAGSLPRFLRRQPGDFPARRQYLWPRRARLEHWQSWLAARGKDLNVGLCWRGGAGAAARARRSIPLDQWQEIMAVSGASFFSLQYGDISDEIDLCNRDGELLTCVPGLDVYHDIDELCAFVSALDLVVTIDNATAHFAAALGTPTLVLLPVAADWRWREHQGRNLFFPTLTCLRQERPGDWRAPLSQAAAHIRDRCTDAANAQTAPAPAPAPRSAARPRAASASTQALLLNDTTDWYHHGCTATSLAIHHRLRRQGHAVSAVPIRQIADQRILPDSVAALDEPARFDAFAQEHADVLAQLEAADIVYVNGEGTLHRLGQQPLALLYLMRIASHRLGKRVRVVNHSCYPEGDVEAAPGIATQLYQRVYEGLDLVAVREPVSATLLRGLGVPVVDTFDCLPLYVEHVYRPGTCDREPYAVIAGGVALDAASLDSLTALVRTLSARGLQVKLLTGANAWPAADEAGFIRSLNRAAGGQLSVEIAHSESQWLDVIRGAQLLVSGRFHHSIAAAFVETPFLTFTSNTPKIAGLMQLLEVDALVPQLATDDASSLLERATALLQNPQPGLLQRDVREHLLDLAERNFAEPPR